MLRATGFQLSFLVLIMTSVVEAGELSPVPSLTDWSRVMMDSVSQMNDQVLQRSLQESLERQRKNIGMGMDADLPPSDDENLSQKKTEQDCLS